MKRLYRVRKGRMIAGICTGLGEYFDVDPVAFRILWVIAGACTAFFGAFIAYLLIALIVPSEDRVDYRG